MSKKSERKKQAKQMAAAHKTEQAHITLSNPVANHFEAFIFANAVTCQRIPPHPWHSPTCEKDKCAEDCRFEKCDAGCTTMVATNMAKGRHLILCGAGPSLRDHADEYCKNIDANVDVWGCNSAAIWLHEHGYDVTHGFTVDQTPEMVVEWLTAPPMEYLVASSVHPHLTRHLIDAGRQTRFFHNYVGIDKPKVAYDGRAMDYEDWMYCALYPESVRAGSGLNAVTRAIDVAYYMGYETITVLGADCALRTKSPLPEGAKVGSPEHIKWLQEETEMHADGGHAMASGATAMTITGEIDGREWTTKPDMIITAVFIVKMKQKMGERLRLVGDTLPAALVDKDDTFLKRLPMLVDKNGKDIWFECDHLEQPLAVT